MYLNWNRCRSNPWTSSVRYMAVVVEAVEKTFGSQLRGLRTEFGAAAGDFGDGTDV